MTEATKAILVNTLKEWAKFTGERDKFTAVAHDVAELAKKCVFESLTFLKTQNVDVEADSIETMKIMKMPVHIEGVIEATFPNVKASVTMKCAGSARVIVINQNLTISAGGTPVTFDVLKKAVPQAFEANAADFVRDAYLYIARMGGKEQPA
jgi:vesicle coat complex subunit